MPEEISLKEWLEIRERRRNDLANPVFTLYSSPKTLREIADSVPLDLLPKERYERITFLRGRYLMTLPACETCGRGDEALTSVLGRKYCLECFLKEKSQAEGRFLPMHLDHNRKNPATAHDIQYHGDGKVELLGRKRKGEK